MKAKKGGKTPFKINFKRIYKKHGNHRQNAVNRHDVFIKIWLS